MSNPSSQDDSSLMQSLCDLAGQFGNATLQRTAEEMVSRYRVAYALATQRQQQQQSAPAGSLQAAHLKLTRPPVFDGKPAELSNFLFQLEQYLNIVGITSSTDKVKFGVTLLSGRALTWWRGKADSASWQLGTLEFDDWAEGLKEQFEDVDRELRLRRRLHGLKQTAGVAAYTSAFRAVLIELGARTLSDGDALFQYVEGLKPAVRQQVYLQRPVDLDEATVFAERADGVLYQSEVRRGPSSSNYRRQGDPVPMELGAAVASSSRGSRGRQWQDRGGRARGRGGEQVCWQCGRTGHFRRDCPDSPKN